ncbi:MAG: peptide chain release factor N(5)-glutamine methyltransferase [Crocinitomix sp.]|nr:peptide chain release factor N(5)-glutamine methyltransferase [Crocinitomix sp.]
MFTSTNKLFDLLPYFKKKLGAHYPDREITTIFYWICEDKYELQKFQVKHSDKRLSESELLEFRSIVKRLEKNEPIQHILGFTEFYGAQIKVNENVLIPRPETEELVDLVLEDCTQGISVLDLCTGSACIAIAIALSNSSIKVSAVDVSADALKTAEQSATLNKVAIELIEMDLLNPNTEVFEEFDIIVSNPPYVLESDKAEMSANVLEFEPHLALFVADADPLLFYREIAEIGREILAKKGLLFFEIHENFGKETIEMLENLGYQNIELRQDMQGKDRMIRCEK